MGTRDCRVLARRPRIPSSAVGGPRGQSSRWEVSWHPFKRSHLRGCCWLFRGYTFGSARRSEPRTNAQRTLDRVQGPRKGVQVREVETEETGEVAWWRRSLRCYSTDFKNPDHPGLFSTSLPGKVAVSPQNLLMEFHTLSTRLTTKFLRVNVIQAATRVSSSCSSHNHMLTRS